MYPDVQGAVLERPMAGNAQSYQRSNYCNINVEVVDNGCIITMQGWKDGQGLHKRHVESDQYGLYAVGNRVQEFIKEFRELTPESPPEPALNTIDDDDIPF